MHNQSTVDFNPVVEAIKRVKDSVVSIIVTKELPEELLNKFPLMSPSGLPSPNIPKQEKDLLPHEHERIQVGGGSGFIVSPEGLILTNKHVVKDATATYSVILANEKVIPAKIISRDPINDIAVLKVEQEEELSTAPLGDSSHLNLGETLIAIGNALGTFRNTVSVGVVSGLSRFLSAHEGVGGAVAHLRGLIQTDAAINPGNSGGPLINIRGETIGISVATVMGAENIGFAIPINSAKRDLEDIKNYGYIRKPFLGIRYIILNDKLKGQFKTSINSGALVIKENIPGDQAVIPASPADKAGIKERDIITELKGEKITEERTIQDILENCKIGETVNISFLRDGKETNVNITLEERR